MEGGSMRPDRSDVRLPAEEQVKIEEAARLYFQGIAPKRPTKPSRSEYSSAIDDHLQDSSSDQPYSIPEFHKLRDLQANNPQSLACDGSPIVVEEYVETEYYRDLNRIDKQHHTTGTGFIKVEKPSGDLFDLNPVSSVPVNGGGTSCKGNPATNEWIPSAVDPVLPISSKPSRSDI